MTISPKTRFLFGGLASIALVITIAAALAITRCSDEEGTTGNSSDARLVKVVGHYNIVKFNGNVYGVPHGVAIDWEKDDLKKVDGMIIGSSVVLVQVSIVGRLMSEKVSRLIKKVSRLTGRKTI